MTANRLGFIFTNCNFLSLIQQIELLLTAHPSQTLLNPRSHPAHPV